MLDKICLRSLEGSHSIVLLGAMTLIVKIEDQFLHGSSSNTMEPIDPKGNKTVRLDSGHDDLEHRTKSLQFEQN